MPHCNQAWCKGERPRGKLDRLSQPEQSEWVAVARLMRPQGRRGELLAEPLTDVPGVLKAGASLRLAPAGAVRPEGNEAVVEQVWEPTGRNAGRVVLKLLGCDDISAAEALAGKQLMTRAEALPALEADTYYVRDLLGCTLWDGETEVGEIVDVQFATTPDGRQRLEDAAPLLEVQRGGEDDMVLVPFVRAYLERVDVAGRRVDVRLPAGLVELDVSGDRGE